LTPLFAFPSALANSFNPRHSLRVRLGLLMGAIAFILSVLAGMSVSYTTSRTAEEDVGADLAQLAYQMADKLDRGMFERYRDIQIIASLDVMRSPEISAPEKRSLLEKLQSTYPDYAWIGLADNQGKVLASTGQLLEGKNVSQRPWYIHGIKAPYVGDVHKALLLEKLLPNPTGEPKRFLDVVSPVLDLQGNTIGALGAHLYWQWTKEVRDSILQPLQDRSQVEMMIASSNGEILLGPVDLQLQPLNLKIIQAGKEGKNTHLVETWQDGRTYLSGIASSQGYRNYPGLGWLILVRQRTDVAFAPVRQLHQQILFWNLVLGLLCAVVGWIIAGQVAQPLLLIADSADLLREGNTNIKIPVFQGKDEIARLSKSLRRLVSTLIYQEQQLSASNEQLERELFERTRAEQEIRLLQELTQAVTEASDFDAALQVALGKVCRATGWNYGEAWIPNLETNRLERSPAWYGSRKSLVEFRHGSLGFTFAPGEGLPGRVWFSQRPEWVCDVSLQSEQVCKRSRLAGETGLKASFGFPLLVEGVAIAVLVFFQFQSQEENKLLLSLVSTVGNQLGAVVQRKQAEEQLRQAKAQLEVRVLERTADLTQANQQLEIELQERLRIEAELRHQQEIVERLLLNVLPQPIAERLKENESAIADNFEEVTILFADIVGFTQLSSQISPVELVNLLNKIFSAFDQLAESHGLEKIKTIGDAYMVVGGVPMNRKDHAEAVANMALDMQNAIAEFNTQHHQSLSIRIGINTGPVVAGVIGIKKFIYDLWGDSVNIASRMESHGVPGCIQVSSATQQRLQYKYQFEKRGAIEVKGKGKMTTYFLTGQKNPREELLKVNS
jgi:class 3 adenylate cyclase/HAMP domain-containing protein